MKRSLTISRWTRILWNRSLLHCRTTNPTFLLCSIDFRRNFTTISPPTFADTSNHSKIDKRWLLERTKDLLNPSISLDATDPELWSDVNHVLRAWLNDDSSPSTSSPPSSLSSLSSSSSSSSDALKRVECCLRLLDRLASILPNGEVWLEPILDTTLLHRLLHLWRQGLMIDSIDSRQRRNFTPSLLAAKMDKYWWASLIQPDVKSFNLLLQTTSLFQGRDGILFADELLCRLVDVSRENEVPLMDVVSIATVMNIWVQNGKPENADQWMQKLHSWKETNRDSYLGNLLPNSIFYSTVLSGWAKVGNVDRVLEILDMQLESFQNGNMEAKVDTITFNCVLDALAKSNDQSAPTQAEALIQQMQHWHCVPDSHSWTTLLACYTRHTPQKAVKRLQQLEEEGRPLTVVAYNTMLQAYARTGQVEPAVRLLTKLESSSELSPDEISYNSVLSAYAKCKEEDAPRRAEALFRHMRLVRVTPSVVSYSILMQCWSKSNHPQAADRAEEILQEMKKHPDTQPNSICYTIVLRAWGNKARIFRDNQALYRALQLFQELVEMKTTSKSLKPTDSTFRAMIHAIVGSAISDKSRMLESLIPAMEKYGFRPNPQDEKLLRRFRTPFQKT